MRSHTARTGAGKGGALHDDRGPRMFRALGLSPRDAVGLVVAAAVTVAILVNVLFLQSGSHPAPMFKDALVPAKSVVATDGAPAAVR